MEPYRTDTIGTTSRSTLYLVLRTKPESPYLPLITEISELTVDTTSFNETTYTSIGILIFTRFTNGFTMVVAIGDVCESRKDVDINLYHGIDR